MTDPSKESVYARAVKAVTVETDSELETHAGGGVDWRYTAGVSASASADALAWARASFEGAPLPMRIFLVGGWTLLLLDGRPRSDASHVLGWPIARATPETTVLQRRSRLGMHATLVFTARDEMVTFASAMAYTNRLGRIVWAGVAPIHRWAVRLVLTHAANVIAAVPAREG
jgi:hypothetical protein